MQVHIRYSYSSAAELSVLLRAMWEDRGFFRVFLALYADCTLRCAVDVFVVLLELAIAHRM